MWKPAASVVFILAAVAAGVYWLVSNYQVHTTGAGEIPPIVSNATSSYPATVFGPAPIASITPGSISVRTNEQGQTLTFVITSATPVYSRVLAGEVGRALKDLKSGDNVYVYPSDNPSQAKYLVYRTKWYIAETPEDQAHAVVGVVTSFSNNLVTITPTSGAPVTITLSTSTPIVTQVAGGQKGLPLAEGRHVRAIRVTTTGDKATAQEILIGNIDVAK